ncbi:hypothetical protein ACFTSF_30145 [Kribbella sp. NPDC056951]
MTTATGDEFDLDIRVAPQFGYDLPELPSTHTSRPSGETCCSDNCCD